HLAAHRREEVDDELRLAYVALTRAQGHLVLWWAASSGTPSAPLHRLLLEPSPGAVPRQRIEVPSDDEALAAFHARAEGTCAAHAVLERTLDPAVVGGVLAAQAPRLLPAAPVDALAAALAPALATPLGPLADDRPLTAFGPRDRLPELEFELPLAGGDEPRAV